MNNFILKVFLEALENLGWIKLVPKIKYYPAPTAIFKDFKVTRPSFFGRVPSYFEALWYPYLDFYRKSNT